MMMKHASSDYFYTHETPRNDRGRTNDGAIHLRDKGDTTRVVNEGNKITTIDRCEDKTQTIIREITARTHGVKLLRDQHREKSYDHSVISYERKC